MMGRLTVLLIIGIVLLVVNWIWRSQIENNKILSILRIVIASVWTVISLISVIN